MDMLTFDSLIGRLTSLPAILGLVVQCALVILASFVVKWLWTNVLIRIAQRTVTTLDERIFNATDRAAQITFIAFGFYITWPLYADSIIDDLGIIVPFIDNKYIGSITSGVFFLFLALSSVTLFWRAFFATIDWFEGDIAPKTATTFDEKILFSLRKVFKVAFIILTFMVVADHFKWPISKIWAVAGIGSLAVALAAKDTFAHVISGIIILFDRPFLVGDRVELADGTFGDVVDIGLRSTKILSFDNTIHIIPNADISNQRITNHSYPDTMLKLGLTFGVAYGTDLDLVKSIINEILETHPKVLKEPRWGIWFTEFGDSSLNLFVRCWIDDYRTKFDVTDDINMAVNSKFSEHNIEIPFPQRDIHIIGEQQPEPAENNPS